MDLRVDTGALRHAADTLSAIASGILPVGPTVGVVHGLAARCGDLRARAAAEHFDERWSCGLGLLRADAAGLAFLLHRCAEVFEEPEARLHVAAGGRAGPASVTPSGPMVGPPVRISRSSPPSVPSSLTPMWSPLSLLAAATHPRELVPGEPDGIDELGARLRSFARDLAVGADQVRRLATGEWVGTAANAFTAEAQQLPLRLDEAATAFDAAAVAFRRYGEEVLAGQALARRAMDQWEQVEAAFRSNPDPLAPRLGLGTDPAMAAATLSGPAAHARDEALRLLTVARTRADTAVEDVLATLRRAADAAWPPGLPVPRPAPCSRRSAGGVPVAAVSAAAVTAGAGIAYMGASNIAKDAAGEDRVTPVSGSGSGPQPPPATGPLPRPVVKDPKLGNLVENLYKGVDNPRAGLGTTADAIRAERATGQATAGKFHTQKGDQHARRAAHRLGKDTEMRRPAVNVAFIGALVYHHPDLRPIIQDHLDDQDGEVLPHLLMADIERRVEEQWSRNRARVLPVLDWMEAAYAIGDTDVTELIAVSFIENLPYGGTGADAIRLVPGSG